MKILVFLLLLCTSQVFCQQRYCEKLIIITIDGVRWQEIFTGADSIILFNNATSDNQSFANLYWNSNPIQRRETLMPFIWSYINKNGQLLGNRTLGNKVNVKNKIRISYTGYNELFTGIVDNSIWTNKPKNNVNSNVLEYLNSMQNFKDSVAVFTSWNCFPNIFNNKRSCLKMNSGYAYNSITKDSNNAELSNFEVEVIDEKKATRKDMLTYLAAKEYLQKQHPKILHIGFGEADELAHKKNYIGYLTNLKTIDNLIADLWMYIQADSNYSNKTMLLITTDHGRGAKASNWHKHNAITNGSQHSWLLALGNCIKPIGEGEAATTIYNSQLAPTIAAFFGSDFLANKKNLVQQLVE